MATTTAADTDVLGDVVRWRARAEWFEISAMLDYRDGEMARTAQIESVMRRQVERSAIAMSIGQATHLSEGQVQLRLSAAETVRDQAPTVWGAFHDGVVDFSRVRDIASTIDKLHRDESIFRLDRLVVAYAAEHTAAELRQWLRRFVERVEADLAVERAEDERDKRHVSITHGDDSMSWLNAYLPSHEAATIEARLRSEARRPVDPDDVRTIAQREADLLVAWCTDSAAARSAIDANIAVTIDADVLAGAVAGFAQSADGRWAVPARWITDVAAAGSRFWHRIVTQPVTGDILSHEYLGRSQPGASEASQAAWCERQRAPDMSGEVRAAPAYHRIPHPEGPTSAANMGPFCRRHHIVKGHGVLRWSIGPPRTPPPVVVEIYPQPVLMEYAA